MMRNKISLRKAGISKPDVQSRKFYQRIPTVSSKILSKSAEIPACVDSILLSKLVHNKGKV